MLVCEVDGDEAAEDEAEEVGDVKGEKEKYLNILLDFCLFVG